MDTNDFIYLDSQATTPVDSRVMERMLPYLCETYGNPHSNDHYFGWRSKYAVDAAREQISSFLNADPDEIIFTSGATEANNLAILGILHTLKAQGRNKLIVSTLEHKCILESARVAQSHGIQLVFLPSDDKGVINPSLLQDLIDEEVGLVSIMSVNNEIGTVQPIRELCKIAHEVGALFHTDAAQAALFLDLDISVHQADMLSLSAHKIYGPKGIGCLYIKRELQTKMQPLIHGGGQELGLRSGTLPTMLCVGMGEACRIAKEERDSRSKTLKIFSEIFWEALKSKCPNIKLNGSLKHRHPANLNIQFPGIDAHSLLQALQPHIAASTGSACTSGTPEPSYVLRAIGLTHEEASSSIRFSFGTMNTKEQILEAAGYIAFKIDLLKDSKR